MPKFTDETGEEWAVRLDLTTVEEIQEDHSIRLVDLESDPFLRMRNDPAVLMATMLVICRDQIDSRGLTREEFLKRLPSPPDTMFDAVQEAIVNFFPTGRASHVREVLANFAAMSNKTDELTLAKIKNTIKDPKVLARLKKFGDEAIERELDKLFSSSST